jgi:DNA-binding MarR family transcriptional regulator
MSKFMKTLNNISRAQAIYRKSRLSAVDLLPSHYAFILAICHRPGRSQDELARELCLNKSTVARKLSSLEEKGYLYRTPDSDDRRQLFVYPSEKMQAVLPEIQAASEEWMRVLCEGIAQEELDVFDSVLRRMQQKAREMIEGQEENK